MKQVNYIKDTKRFWQERKNARASLDIKQGSASPTQKAVIAEKLRSDARFLKSVKVISVKS